MLDNETPLTILKRLIAAIEKHNELLEGHRNVISNVLQQLEKQNQRLKKLEAGNFSSYDDLLSQTDTTVADIISQLKAIADASEGHT